MAKLEETWTNIQNHLKIYHQLNSSDLSERRQAMLKILAGTRKLQADIDYFLENAPRGDLRLDMALDLKGLMAKPPDS